MKVRMLVAICLIVPCASAYAQPSKFSVHQFPNHEIGLTVDSQLHSDYGISYPLTHEIALPANSTGLLAYRRYSVSEPWSPVAEKTSTDFFNGEEALRFDYDSNRAYLSVAFGWATDSIYLKITDAGGQNLPIAHERISRYYDNRAAAVTVTADDWHPSFDGYFLYALSIFRKHRLWVATAIVTEWNDAATWQHIQTQLDSGFVEPMAHGRNHIHAPYPDPAYEVTGAKTDIIENLNLPAMFRNGDREYVYIWVAPYGEYDDDIDALVSEN